MHTLKEKIVIAVCILFSTFCFSQQEGGLGVKAGLNYASNGEYTSAIMEKIDDPSRAYGYHVGIFGKADLGIIYVRPELVYTHTNSEYRLGDLRIDKLDAPVLLGIDFLKHLTVFAGPSFQYIIDTDFENVTLEDVEQDFTAGAVLGIGVNINSLGIDLRYERGLTENEVSISNIPGERVDTRPDQIILGLSIKL